MWKKSLRLQVIAFSTVSLLIGCQSPTLVESAIGRKPTQDSATRFSKLPHLVFFIHGYKDNGFSFRQFPDLLQQSFYNDNVRTFQLTYPSSGSDASSKFNVFDFAKIISAQIISTFVEEGIRDRSDPRYMFPVDMNTTYSIVAHSQGGLVTMNYLNSCLLDGSAESMATRHCKFDQAVEIFQSAVASNDPRITQLLNHRDDKQNVAPPPNLINFISLGTPFWGSPVASATLARSSVLNPAEGWLTKQFPRTQTDNLAIGGISTTLSRVWSLNRNSKDWSWTGSEKWVSRYGPQVRFFNVSGYIGDFIHDKKVNWKDWLIGNVLDIEKYELDVVVAIPQANPDYFYKIENSGGLNKPQFNGHTKMSQAFLPMNLHHMTSAPIPGMAGVSKENEQTSPTFAVVHKVIQSTLLEIATGRKSLRLESDIREILRQQYPTALTEEVNNFTSEFKLITPIGYHRKFRIGDEAVQITPKNPERFTNTRFKQWPILPSGQNPNALKLKNNYYQTYYHTGAFTSQWAWKPREESFTQFIGRNAHGYKINYEVKVLGFQSRQFQLSVLPGITSYAEVFLYPVFAFENGQSTDIARGARPLNQLILPRSGISIDLSLDSDLKLVSQRQSLGRRARQGKIENNRADQGCWLGVRGLNTPDESGLQSHITASLSNKIGADHLGALYRQALDDEKSGNLPEGEVVEILGRFVDGFRDPATGVTRPCLGFERPNFGPLCDKKGVDRYLITSKSIRQRDGVGYSGLDSKNGLRWINAVDLDVLNEPIMSGDLKTFIPADKCLLGNPGLTYLPNKYMLARYYRFN